ncbi:hypothetical protein CesoFtcFv8_022672 [Champsocephalus esox]|uniref:Uncharacterized protein n=1 Tax=Champsocephalus esox TaxID=159716 RepID=A0AAN8B7X4_9TELE|nr:hypothetical protein CesoFtcFv8_022672 [Champsocephalus esox]
MTKPNLSTQMPAAHPIPLPPSGGRNPRRGDAAGPVASSQSNNTKRNTHHPRTTNPSLIRTSRYAYHRTRTTPLPPPPLNPHPPPSIRNGATPRSCPHQLAPSTPPHRSGIYKDPRPKQPPQQNPSHFPRTGRSPSQQPSSARNTSTGPQLKKRHNPPPDLPLPADPDSPGPPNTVQHPKLNPHTQIPNPTIAQHRSGPTNDAPGAGTAPPRPPPTVDTPPYQPLGAPITAFPPPIANLGKPYAPPATPPPSPAPHPLRRSATPHPRYTPAHAPTVSRSQSE